MNILIISLNYAPEPTGIAPYSAGLAEGLAARGHVVRVITGVQHYPEWRNVANQRAWRRTERRNGVTVIRQRHHIPSGGTGWRRALLEMSFALSVAIAPWKRPDVVVSVSPSLGGAAASVIRGKARNVPVIVWVQDLYSRGVSELNASGKSIVALSRFAERSVLKRADSLVVIHDRFAMYLSERLRIDASRMSEIRNWAHLDQGGEEASGDDIRKRFGWADRVVILHSGSMGVKQGLDEVVAAARLSEAEGRGNLFVFMGDGSERPRLEALSRDCSAVALLPPLPQAEFRAALASADILLLNEKVGVREMALPSKLTTYFSAGRPVVAAVADDGTSAGELRAAKAGVVVPPGIPGALLQAIEDIQNSPDRGHQYGTNGREYARRTLLAGGILDKWEQLLSVAVGAHTQDRSVPRRGGSSRAHD